MLVKRLSDAIYWQFIMFAQAPSWLARSPSVRRPVIKLWRVLLRLQRATVAHAVLVVRRRDGHVFTLALPSGELRLPKRQLDAWVPITTQVEDWLHGLLQQTTTTSLVAIDGSPGGDGVTFLYTAMIEAARPRRGGECWLEPAVAASSLSEKEGRLLHLCIGAAS